MAKCGMCRLLTLAICVTSSAAAENRETTNGISVYDLEYQESIHGKGLQFGSSRAVAAKGSPIEAMSAPIPNKAEMLEMDRDLAHKLNKMKELISGIHSGVDQSSKMRASAMKIKFNRLSHVIATLAKQKDSLYKENVKLKKEMKATVEKLLHVTSQLKREAKRANDNDVKRWFNHKAGEISKFLHSNGLQNYQDPKFSPLFAGIAAYGLVLIPLTMASAFVTSNVKGFSLLHALQAINIFECGYVTFSLFTMLLLMTTDPWHAMQVISEINFTFIQLSIACLFWSSAIILVMSSIRASNAGIRRNLVCELVIRCAVAADYGSRVWIPVVERVEDPVAVPLVAYFGYFCAVWVAHRLTSNARKYAAIELGARSLTSRLENPLVFDPEQANEQAPRTPATCAAQVANDAAQTAGDTASAAQSAIQQLMPSTQLHTD